MASAQVTPNPAASKRDEIMLKGRQKLEEFRKYKAGGRAKKAAPPRQLQPTDVDQHEKFSQKSEHVGDRSMAMIGSSSITRPSEISLVHGEYIEDLTQEKFSLQRALGTSRSLAESLAAENSSLTESYNQHGQVLNQLQSDIDRMQEEVKAQLLVLESVRSECTNAQLECNAADERVKILATEVISLEEKALRLRSNELKLEKQLGTMTSEISSYKYKVSSFEKERQDFRSTIDAMLEEKKLLQSKLREASVSGKMEISATSTKRDAFTSTEDLGGGHLDGETNVAEVLHEITPSLALSRESSSFSLLSEAGRSSLPDASGIIPSDQLRMIDNINSLTSELALEKQELIRALGVESANSSKLKDLNKDLSQKLESQTQRLELLTAQRMANENILTKPMEIHSMHDTRAYADEGDEVWRLAVMFLLYK